MHRRVEISNTQTKRGVKNRHINTGTRPGDGAGVGQGWWFGRLIPAKQRLKVMAGRGGAAAPCLKPAYLFACQKRRKETHREQTVPSSPPLTSSFSLLPSYCVGGGANRKVRVSEWR